MDGREFEVLADVVSLLLTPGPSVDTLIMEERLLVESENEEVDDARQLYLLVRQQLASLRAEALEVRKCLGLELRRSGDRPREGGQPRRSGAELLSFCAAGTGDEDHTTVLGSADLLPVATALREHLAGEALAAAELQAGSRSESPGPGSSPSHASSSRRRQSVHPFRDQVGLLLRWVDEQEAGAVATYARTRATLLQLKAAASKRLLSRSASRVLVQLDRIVWQLCSADKQPFVQASLRGLSFDRHRNRDHSGEHIPMPCKISSAADYLSNDCNSFAVFLSNLS